MATILIDNFPEALKAEIEGLASQHRRTVNEQIIAILQEAINSEKPPLKFIVSPETDPTWEERRKAVPKLLAEIDSRRRLNPSDYGLPDSTELIREDRQR
ncbi:MAG: hypothetical protein SXA11_05030 [Cyanobacteriota bacterium]|nr:hypothetical protein [Cyanobacteriota bacterium]